MKRTAIEKVGLLEDRFYIHADDLEFCMRLRQHGKILLVPASVVVHKEAGRAKVSDERSRLTLTSKRLPFERLWMQYFVRRNSVYYMKLYARWRPVQWLWIVNMAVRSTLAILLFDDHKRRSFRVSLHLRWGHRELRQRQAKTAALRREASPVNCPRDSRQKSTRHRGLATGNETPKPNPT